MPRAYTIVELLLRLCMNFRKIAHDVARPDAFPATMTAQDSPPAAGAAGQRVTIGADHRPAWPRSFPEPPALLVWTYDAGRLIACAPQPRSRSCWRLGRTCLPPPRPAGRRHDQHRSAPRAIHPRTSPSRRARACFEPRCSHESAVIEIERIADSAAKNSGSSTRSLSSSSRIRRTPTATPTSRKPRFVDGAWTTLHLRQFRAGQSPTTTLPLASTKNRVPMRPAQRSVHEARPRNRYAT